MPVVAWSRRFDGEDRELAPAEAEALGLADPARAVSFRLAPSPAEVAGRCDVLSVHLALSDDTRGLVGADVLARLRPGAALVNTARAEVVDAAALAAAVRERGLRVGADVFAGEPAGGSGAFADPLVALPGVYGTHHVGASTDQAQEAIAAETVRLIRLFAETGRSPAAVNLARRSPATHRLVVRHENRPGVLAEVFERLRADGLNVLETENVVFAGAHAAIASIHLDRAASAGALAAIERCHEAILSARQIVL
jgi:D-3-phosphoglycerate dehydrogenase